MKTITKKKTAVFPPAIAFLLLFMLFVSCKKDIHNDSAGISEEVPDLSTKINSSVSGFVTGENNVPVENAVVQFGGSSVSTDAYGFFEIKNVPVTKIAAVVTITKAGYFKAIKTYGATADKAAFFRIKMIPKITAGTINSVSGGNILLPNGLMVALPANAVMHATNSTSYSGDVNVAAFWIDPEATDLTGIMPGDLRGIDNSGLLKGLTTFGMSAVELTGTGGELLQITTGKKATITMPLSSLLSAAAPASIPLWYFDESNGLWKEEGSAVKTGNTYVGEVSHFSYWNCDLPNTTVPLTFTVVDGSGNPLANAHIEITPTPGSPYSWSHIGGWTDPKGYVSVFVTANSSYNLEVYGSCNLYGGTPGYTQSFSVSTTQVDLGNIAISNATSATVSGTITDCSGNPVSNGYLIVQDGYNYTRYPVDNNGAYNFSTIVCNGSTTVNLVAEDMSNSQQGTPVPFTLVTGPNAIGNIQACGTNTNEFVTCSVDGTVITLAYPDSVWHAPAGIGTPNTTYIHGTNNAWNATFVAIAFNDLGIAAGTTQPLVDFSASNIPVYPTSNTPIGVNIIEYGPVGGFIAGNFSGTFTDGGLPPNQNYYQVVCSFRVRRRF